MKALQMLGLPIVLCRDRTGMLSAMRDICPHRGMPLSFGRFDGERVECPYHGWQFDTKGRCQRIPALPDEPILKTDKIGIATYPAEETDGMIWLYLADERGNLDPLPPVPRMPLPSEPRQPVPARPGQAARHLNCLRSKRVGRIWRNRWPDR